MAIANITNNILTDSGVATSSLQPTITLTTTGTSGAATLVGATLNIPQYQAAGTYVTSVTASAPLSSSGSTNPNITITQVSSTVDGYLSFSDYNVFSGKISGSGTAGYITRYTGSGSTIGNSGLYDDGTTVSLISRALSGSSASFGSSVTATSFVKTGGTSAQFLKADGSVDSSTYLTTSAAASTYLPLTGGTLTGPLIGTTATFSGVITSTQGNNGTLLQGTSATTGWVHMIRATNTGQDVTMFIENSTGGDRAIGTLPYAAGLCTYTNTALQFGTNNNIRLTIGGTGAATFSSSVQADGSSSGFLISQNGGAAGLATYSANSDRAQIAFKYAQNYPASNNYTRVLDIVSTGDATGGGAIRFLTSVNNAAPTEKMLITSGGNVLIGTTTDNGSKLQVQGGIRFNYSDNYGYFGLNYVSGADYGFYNYNYGRIDLKISQSTGAATFSSSVTATSFFESSDSRLKTLIQDNYQTKGIASITPKLYTKNGKVELGYYAQDFVGVLDSAVSKGEDDMLSLSYREVLVAKVYALEQEIKELKAKIN